MKTITEHISKNEYKNVYLLHGEEEYLKKQYRDKLRQAISGDDTMNYSYYQGDGISVRDVIDTGNTLPFFSERRLIIIENSGFLKSSNEELADFIKSLPDYLIIVFVEKDIDKRNKVYKAIETVGYICEMKPQTTQVLSKWIVGILAKENLRITADACELLLDKTGAGMDLIKQELDKLISYCNGKEAVTAQDVEAVCSTQTVSHIFDMLSAIAMKQQETALNLYYDLLTLKEQPMRILYLLVRQFNGIMQVKEMQSEGISGKEMASRMGAAPFMVNKYVAQAKHFSIEMLHEAIEECALMEEKFKSGLINDKLAVELIIVKYSDTRGF